MDHSSLPNQETSSNNNNNSSSKQVSILSTSPSSHNSSSILSTSPTFFPQPSFSNDVVSQHHKTTSSGMNLLSSYKERKYKYYHTHQHQSSSSNNNSINSTSDRKFTSDEPRSIHKPHQTSSNSQNKQQVTEVVLPQHGNSAPSSSAVTENSRSPGTKSRSRSVNEHSAPINLFEEKEKSLTSNMNAGHKRSSSFEDLSSAPKSDSEQLNKSVNTANKKRTVHHQRDKFLFDGDKLLKKPSPMRTRSENTTVHFNKLSPDMIDPRYSLKIEPTQDLVSYSMDLNKSVDTLMLPRRSDDHPSTIVHHRNDTNSLGVSSARGPHYRKAFPASWIPSSNSSKFKGIGNPEYNSINTAGNAIKHSFKEFKKNIRDGVERGVTTVRNAPSFIKSVPKKIIPKQNTIYSNSKDDIKLDILEDFPPFEEQQREAIGEVYITNIQTRNLKSVEGYVAEPVSTQNSQKQAKGSILSMEKESIQTSPRSTDNSTENILYEDYITYCEVLCEGKKHITMPLAGAYLNKKLKWSEEFKFYISDETSSISVEIFHSPVKPKSKNQIICLGFVSIPLSKVKIAKERILDDWFSLTTPLGTKLYTQVHLQIQYVPYQNPALSAADLELLDNMSLEPTFNQSSEPLKSKPQQKALLDALNIDVQDSSLENLSSLADQSDGSFSLNIPMVKNNLIFENYQHGKDQKVIQRVQDELKNIDNTLRSEMQVLKSDLAETKKQILDVHEVSKIHLSVKQKKIDNLKNKVDKLESRMNHLSNVVLQLNSAHSTTKDKVISHDEDLKLYESRIKELENKVQLLHSQRVSIKLKEWIFYFLAILLFVFSKIIVLTGYVYKRIKLRRPPQSNDMDDTSDDEDTFSELRKRMDGAEKKYRQMATNTKNMELISEEPRKNNTTTNIFSMLSPLLPFLQKANEIEEKLSSNSQIFTGSSKHKSSFSNFSEPTFKENNREAYQDVDIDKIMVSKKNSKVRFDSSSSSDDEEERLVREFNSKRMSKSASLSSITSSDETASFMTSAPETSDSLVSSNSRNVRENPMHGISSVSPIMESSNTSLLSIQMPEHQQTFLLNQLKKSFDRLDEYDEMNEASPDTTSKNSNELDNSSMLSENAVSPNMQPSSSGIAEVKDQVDSKEQSIIEETEKLQSISRFFRKSESNLSNVKLNERSKAHEDEESGDDFDSWFNKVK
ncbi:hypothetical protein FDP41_003156 [Naegleria fowleri]|uniref:C2 domain-containing protein n=1 Tax=Naegleria fowleri TaxID=5763 RepID=A0A6A5BUA3_NAEFO|nr:uncharacterized protein FDP41_003156 [Naegleria fowleri]KAF0977834.1 hypothetical protein FDP41_003156 [Naegleria fowleri]